MSSSFFRRLFNGATAPAPESIESQAERGSADAQFSLGLKFANGKGATLDYAQAASWYLKAAEQNHALAQFNLGVMYANGTSVAQSSIEALKWLSLAAARSSGAEQKKYADAREIVARTMTPDEVAEAQKRAREWTDSRRERPN